MPDREQVLKDALGAGIAILEETFGKDYDRELVLKNVPLLVEVMWPFIEGYHQRDAVRRFDDLFRARFPNHVLTSYGGSIFDYIVGNVQTAVTDEIILLLETWAATIKDAQNLPGRLSAREKRDWEIALAHTNELISEVRQYRTRGAHGHHSTHTGSIPTTERND